MSYAPSDDELKLYFVTVIQGAMMFYVRDVKGVLKKTQLMAHATQFTRGEADILVKQFDGLISATDGQVQMARMIPV